MTTSTSTSTVVSTDGTEIAYDRRGDGPPLVVVLGAFNDRATHADFSAELSRHFTVYTYDRRGRGASGDHPGYTVDREIADLAAVLDRTGGSAAVFGYSSGALLALAGAHHGLPISALALYEPAPVADLDHRRAVAVELAHLVAAGRRGEAVELFQTAIIGIPEPVVTQLRNAPFRPALEAMAHTLVYETTIVGGAFAPADLGTGIDIPTLVLVGEQSPPIMHTAAREVAEAISTATLRTLQGQNHDIVPRVVAPALRRFLRP